MAIGHAWLRSKASAVLRVPSVPIPEESNFLLNPAHAEFAKLAIGTPKDFRFDPRLINELNELEVAPHRRIGEDGALWQGGLKAERRAWATVGGRKPAYRRGGSFRSAGPNRRLAL
jgi:hypothetical protein